MTQRENFPLMLIFIIVKNRLVLRVFYRNRINAAIVQLTDSGELTRLENKWWFDECGYEAKVSDTKLSAGQIQVPNEFWKICTRKENRNFSLQSTNSRQKSLLCIWEPFFFVCIYIFSTAHLFLPLHKTPWCIQSRGTRAVHPSAEFIFQLDFFFLLFPYAS